MVLLLYTSNRARLGRVLTARHSYVTEGGAAIHRDELTAILSMYTLSSDHEILGFGKIL